MTVRVLAVHPRDIAEPTGGGIQTFLRDFIAYSPADFEVSVAGVTSDPEARPVGKWQSVPVGSRSARFLPVARSGSLLRHPGGLFRTLPALRVLRRAMTEPGTILQVHRPYRSFILDGHNGPWVQIIHLDLDAWPGPSGWRRLNWMYRDFGDGLERFDRVFVANEAGALKLRADNPSIADRIQFLPVWYDDLTFRPPAVGQRMALRSQVAADLGLPLETTVDRWVVAAGRLDPIKDLSLAVDTVALLALQRPSEVVRFIVCGEGEERDAVAARATERGIADRMHLVGNQPRTVVARLMAASDALLVTSLAEGGGPRVVIEALGSGLPVVSTIVGMVRRSVTSGVNGQLVETRTAEALADGLNWTLDQHRDAIADAATAAVRPFIASAVLSQLYDTYRDLAAQWAASVAPSGVGQRSG